MAWFRCAEKSIRIPPLYYVESKSRMYEDATFTYTFAENGKYQYILVLGNDITTTASNLTITLNSTVLIPTTHTYSLATVFCGEVTVSADDVLTITAPLYQQLGANVYIFEDVSLSNIDMIGFAPNDGSTFSINIPENTPYIEVFKTGYHAGNNNFNYIYSLKGMEPHRDSTSIPTPSGDQSCWWGYTYVITI